MRWRLAVPRPSSVEERRGGLRTGRRQATLGGDGRRRRRRRQRRSQAGSSRVLTLSLAQPLQRQNPLAAPQPRSAKSVGPRVVLMRLPASRCNQRAAGDQATNASPG